MISSKGAVDYGHHRFSYAYKRFAALAEMLELEHQNKPIPNRILVSVQEGRAYQEVPTALFSIDEKQAVKNQISIEKKKS